MTGHQGARQHAADRELTRLSVAELSSLLEQKRVSPVEVTTQYLDRVAELDGDLHAYITVTGDQALDSAHAAEREIVGGTYRGPLHGVPVAVKDQLNTKGILTTSGSTILADHVPDADATTVARMKRGGAVVLGKTNLTEFAMSGYAHRFDAPRNPWDHERHPGGSSSGSAVATSASLCALALGEDTGGSIRFPAAWCGVVGLRPTWSRVSRFGFRPAIPTIDTVGPITRCVEDAAIALQAIAGYDRLDELSSRRRVPDYRDGITSSIKGITVGLIAEMVYDDAVTSVVRESIVAAADLLASLGANVEEVSIPSIRHAADAFGVILLVEQGAPHLEWLRTKGANYTKASRVDLAAGVLVPARHYLVAKQMADRIGHDVRRALTGHQVLISPTVAEPAWTYDEVAGATGPEAARRSALIMTRGFSLAGVPTVALPCGFSDKGLPLSSQLCARPFDEKTLLRVAHAYEAAAGWRTRRPPIAD